MSDTNAQLTDNEYALAMLAIQAGSAVGDVLASAGKGVLDICGQAVKKHGEIKKTKASEKERVIIQKKLINLSDTAMKIRMECETNLAIFHNNALVAQAAIQKGIITHEDDISRICNISVSDSTLQSLCMKDINMIK